MNRRSSHALTYGLYPYVVWLSLFLAGPLLFVIIMSFQDKGLWGGVFWTWSGANYRRALDPLYVSILWSSIKLAGVTSAVCLCLGLPMAWFMTRIPVKFKTGALLLVLMPFISNFVVRTYALKFLIGVEGPLNQLLSLVGIVDKPLFVEDVRLAVWFGMVTNYLPFMILPLYVALERFDFSLIEAARDLGGNSLTIFVKIVWPLVKPAIVTGLTLVFVPAMGELLIPDLLGGGKTMYVGNLLAEQFLKARDWPFGASLCVLMMSFVGFFSLLIKRGAKL